MGPPPFIVGIAGALRPGSTSERALEVTLQRARDLGCETEAFAAARLPATIFDPGQAAMPAAAAELVAALRRADGIVLATPSYHGSMSGLLKNTLDYVEALRTDTRVYFQGRAVGCIVCAEGPQAIGSTLSALRAIVHALRGWPTPYGAAIQTSGRPFGAEGQAADPAALQACQTVAEEVVAFARMARGAAPSA